MEVIEIPIPPVCVPSLYNSRLAVSALHTQLEEAVFGATLRHYGEVRDGHVERHHGGVLTGLPSTTSSSVQELFGGLHQ